MRGLAVLACYLQRAREQGLRLGNATEEKERRSLPSFNLCDPKWIAKSFVDVAELPTICDRLFMLAKITFEGRVSKAYRCRDGRGRMLVDELAKAISRVDLSLASITAISACPRSE